MALTPDLCHTQFNQRMHKLCHAKLPVRMAHPMGNINGRRPDTSANSHKTRPHTKGDGAAHTRPPNQHLHMPPRTPRTIIATPSSHPSPATHRPFAVILGSNLTRAKNCESNDPAPPATQLFPGSRSQLNALCCQQPGRLMSATAPGTGCPSSACCAPGLLAVPRRCW